MKPGLTVLVTPRDGLHYQDLLYRDAEAFGVRVRYAQGPTPSQTLNVMLSPVMLLWHRMRGCRILHIHWVFQFALPWARHQKWALKFMEWWFGLYLRTSRLLGYAIVWTAHDLLPHEQVFADDRRARDLLVSKSKAVIALTEATASDLRELGAHIVRVIPMGSYAEPYPVSMTTSEARASFGFEEDDVVVSLIGRIESYKGADLLLRAVAQLPITSKIKLLVAGICTDKSYRDELDRLTLEVEDRVTTRFEWVPEGDLARYFQATDVAAFPFREITNSASISLAQSFGKPVIVADLPTLRELPDDAVLRFGLGIEALVSALQAVEKLTSLQYQAMSAAGLAWATRTDWREVARETAGVYELARIL